MSTEPAPTSAFVDAATFDSVVSFLDRDRPADVDNWHRQAAIEATQGLILNRHLRFAPAPEPSAAGMGDYERLQRGLATMVSPTLVPQDLAALALRRTKKWLYRRQVKLRQAFEGLYTSDNCEAWLRDEVRMQWRNHSIAEYGLFNRSLLPQLSLLLGVSREYLAYLLDKSRRPDVVERYAREMRDTEDFVTTRKAYTLAGVIRATYHEYVAKIWHPQQQVLHHPFRRDPSLLPRLRMQDSEKIAQPNTAFAFSKMVLGSAMRMPRRLRVEAYVDYMKRAKDAYLRGDIDLSGKGQPGEAINAAARAGRTIRLRTHTRPLYEICDLFAACAIGSIAYFVVHPFAGVPISVGAYYAERWAERGRWGLTIGHLFDTKGALRDIGGLRAGRIDTSWHQPPAGEGGDGRDSGGMR